MKQYEAPRMERQVFQNDSVLRNSNMPILPFSLRQTEQDETKRIFTE
ncbi:MAG: hypothetical protein IJC84_02830 [Clostridia bacterium]|nr:hypothetical protein [Clostridia bacterium]